MGVATGVAMDRGIVPFFDGTLGVDLKWHSASFPGNGEVMIPVSSSARIGEVVAALLERWDQVKNSYLLVAGCVVSMRDVI